MTRRLLALGLILFLAVPALAETFPTQAHLRFQTSGPSRAATIGDWYTTSTSGSTDRRHRFAVNVTAEMLAAGNVTVTVNDAESNGALDEVDGVADATSATTSDPTRFELRAPDGVTVLAGRTFPTGSPNGSSATFTITPAMGPGTYQVTSVTGALPISGVSTPGLNDDDNTFTLNVVGGSLDILVGSLQGTFQHDSAGTLQASFYFLVGPGTGTLALRNFDGDGGGTVAYRRPNGSTVAGTMSGNGVWNGGGSLNAGQDTISGLGASDVGIWGLTLQNFTSNNQIALEVLADGNRRLYFDKPPAVAGNFQIADSGTLATTVGVAVDHPFTVTNLFQLSDVVDFSLGGTAANYSVALLTAAGVPVTDSNADGRPDTGVLAPGEARSFLLRVTPQAGAGSSSTTTVAADSMLDRAVDASNNAVRSVARTTTIPAGVTVSGTVYRDANHDADRQATEGGTGLSGLYVKAVPAAGGNAVAAAAVAQASGDYSLAALAAGTYVLRLDDNATLGDTVGRIPAGWIGTEGPAGERTVTVSAAVTEQDLGLYQGSVISGVVFRDDGSAGGTAHDGVRQAGEAGLPSVPVELRQGATVLDRLLTAGDGSYRLYAPASAGGATLTVQERDLPQYVSVGGSAGTTGGTYTLAADTVTFVLAASPTAYTGVSFGDVPLSMFLQDNRADVEPGGVAFYPHRFLAGSAGSVNFVVSRLSHPPLPNWSSVLYRDLDGDGEVDEGEPVVSGAIPVAAGQEVPLVLKEFVPENAPLGASDQVTLTATLTPTGAPQALSFRNVDLTTVRAHYGVKLEKVVNRTVASSGEVLSYTITFTNHGAESLSDLVVKDRTPAFTTYQSASAGPLPAGLTGVTVTAPAVGAEGVVTWTFAGSLRPGATGSVTFQVKVR